ncbi:MAG: gliding motility-associated C-terminal domain-containing protein, partial [Bacteroidia bacterium]|nr:gliding motility-associated C-terminal domain-containing protein [Bacteroidia bacterium]
RAAVIVTVNPAPATPTASGTTICSGSTATLTATAPSGAQFNWYNAATGGTLLQGNSATYTTPALSATTTYYVEAYAGACTSARAAVIVTVNPAPATPTASGTTICSGSTATLTATAPSGAQFNWYNAATGGTLLQGNSATYTTPALSATTTYYVEAYAGACTSARAAVIVTVNPIPATPNPSSNSPVCEGQSINLTTNTVSGASYYWTGPNSFTSTSQNPSISNATTLMAGTYYVRIIVGQCTSATNSTQVVVSQLSHASILGLPDSMCLGDPPITLSGTPTGGTFSGSGISGNVFDPSGLSAGTQVVITYTGTDICGSYSVLDTILLTNIASAQILGLPDTVCYNFNSFTLIATPTGGTFEIDGNTGSVFNPTALGSNRFVLVRYFGSGNCGSYDVQDSVFIRAIPTVTFSGLPDSICVAGGTVSLTGFPSGGIFSGSGISGNQFSPVGLTPGQYSIQYEYADGCSLQQVSRNIRIVEDPQAAILGLPDTVCAPASPISLTASPSGGTLSGNGITGNQFNPSGLSSGNYVITYQVAGFCGSQTVTDTVFVRPAPTASMLDLPDSICVTQGVVALAGTPPNGIFSGVNVTGNQFTTTGLVAGSYTIYYTVIEVCGTAIDSQVVRIIEPQDASFSGLQTHYCAGDTEIITLTPIIPGGYFWLDGIPTNNPFPVPNTIGPHSVVYDLGIGICPSRTTQQFTVEKITTNLLDTIQICIGEQAHINLQVSGSQGYTVQWQPTQAVDNPTSSSPNFIDTVSTRLTVTILDTTTGCTAQDSVEILVRPAPVADFYPLMDSVEVPFMLTVHNNSRNATQYRWYFEGKGDTIRVEHPDGFYLMEPGMYNLVLVAANDLGCLDTTAHYIFASDIKPALYIPNAFTPNGDGRNDEFLPFGVSIDQISFKIYDRWGVEVYTAEHINSGWPGTKNGKDCPEGVYVYRIRFKFVGNNEFEIRAGTVTLIR